MILDDLVRRDRIDSTRGLPAQAAEGSVKMDSSSMTVEEEVQRIVSLMVAAGWRGKGADAADGGEVPGHEVAANPAGVTGAPTGRQATARGGRHRWGTSRVKALQGGGRRQAGKPGAPGWGNRQGRNARLPQSQPPRLEPPARKRDRMRAFAGSSFDDYFDHDMRDFPAPGRAMLRFVAAVVGGVTKVLWPWTIEDADKLWGDHRGRVIVMNHTSMLDPVCVIVSTLFHGQRVRCVYRASSTPQRS